MNLSGAPLAVEARSLEAFAAALAAATPEAAAARPASESMTLAAGGAVAVVPIVGPMLKADSWVVRAIGGTSMRARGAALRAADADPTVRAIVLSIDSPGGTVDGTQELADVVASLRKPVVAWADGCMCSAAYWVGSAARGGIYLASETASLGSIGVVATHVDYSAAEARFGVKVTEVAAGKYKRIAGQHAPLSDEGRAVLQSEVDAIYSVFVDTVARNRGVTVDRVLERMADGRVFLGDAAIAAGLADGYASLDELVARMANPSAAAARRWAAGVERALESLSNAGTNNVNTNTTSPATVAEAHTAAVLEYSRRHGCDVAHAARMLGKLDDARRVASSSAATPRDRAHARALELMAADPSTDYMAAIRAALAEVGE